MKCDENKSQDIDGVPYHGFIAEEGFEITEEKFTKLMKSEDSLRKLKTPKRMNEGNLLFLCHVKNTGFIDIHRVYKVMRDKNKGEKRITLVTENVTSPNGKNARLFQDVGLWNMFYSDLEIEKYYNKISRKDTNTNEGIEEESLVKSKAGLIPMVFDDITLCKKFGIGDEIIHRVI